LLATMGILPCWAAESTAGKNPPSPKSKAVAEKSADSQRSMDLRPLFQKWELDARDQGGRGTCSVFSMTAAIEYAVATKRQHTVRLSVECLNWAANQADNTAIDGGTFVDLWRGFATHGICPEAEMPYAAEFDAARKPNEKAIAHAKAMHDLHLRLHWIKEWDSSQGASDAHLAEIKKTLERQWPVCAGFLWPKNERGLWKKRVLQVCPRSEVMDGHTILIVGFRDDKTQPGGGVFLIRNSSGRRRDSMLSYEYLRAYMNDAVWIDFPGATKGGPRGDTAPGKPSTTAASKHAP
jgi:C1A family cysteine protease